MAHVSHSVGIASHMRSSTVPYPGCGRMSHHTSRTLSMVPALMSVSRKSLNSAQLPSSGGRPVVGIASKTLVRMEAMPVSWPCQ